ncbi:unnamed protein product, partial [marine sediment metagenome]
ISKNITSLKNSNPRETLSSKITRNHTERRTFRQARYLCTYELKVSGLVLIQNFIDVLNFGDRRNGV